MSGLGAILPNPADAPLTRSALDRRPPTGGARFAAVLAGARRPGPSAPVAAPESEPGLTEEEQSFLQEVVEPLREKARELESFLYLQALTTMRRALRPRDNILHGGPAEESYAFLLDLERAKSVAGGGGSSLAQIMTRQFLTGPQRERLEAIEKKLSRPAERPGTRTLAPRTRG